MPKGKGSHKRGGMHRVRDQDRTWTHWDDKTYEELRYAAKERPGLYRKDMKKAEIAKALAADDKALDIKYKKQKRDNERQLEGLKKRVAREQRERERLRNVVTDSRPGLQSRKVAGNDDMSNKEVRDIIPNLEPLSTSNYDAMIAGKLLSEDDDWDETSASETPLSAAISPIFPRQELRIFEWPYPVMPSRVPPQPKYPRSINLDKNDIMNEALPRNIPYVVMDLVTMISHEKVELPSRQHKEATGPDLVPKLGQHTIECARNGIMIRSLRTAVIERGTDWAKRTRLQGWNARMYFYLPPRSSSVSLIDVYAKWNRPVKSVDSRTARVIKRGLNNQVEKMKDQRQKLLEILAASEWRPPICYLPAYLDHLEPEENVEGSKSVDNLFYVRFPGMDLPHFYFWADGEEWANPTISNPEWVDAKVQDEEDERQEAFRRQKMEEHKRTRQGDEYSMHTPYLNLDHTRIRVKKSRPPRKFQYPPRPPKGSKYKVALWNIERDLYQEGSAITIYKYRTRWLAEGKAEHWQFLSKNLPEVYPSGKFPDTPPVHHRNVSCKSLAERLAAVEVPRNDIAVSPIRGDEPWTRDDDAYWSIVSVPSSAVSSPEALHRAEDFDLEICAVMPSPQLRSRSEASFHQSDYTSSWLSASSSSSQSAEVRIQKSKQKEWEELFLEHVERARKQVPLIAPPPSRTSTRCGQTTLWKSSMLAPRDEVMDLFGKIEEMPATELKYQHMFEVAGASRM